MSWLSFARIALALACCPAAFSDVGGSRDPLGMPRYADAEIVAYEVDEGLRPRDFVISPVEKIRRDLLIEEKVRVRAAHEEAVYELPPSAPTDEVFAHYEALLGDDVLFRCTGRDCGRSNQWANQVLGHAVLYGPDANQSYLAARRGQHLVSVYVIRRGNKRVYVHVGVLTPEGEVAVASNDLVLRRLSGNGHAVVEGVRPRSDGSFAPDAQNAVIRLGETLSPLGAEQVYVVCHIYGPGAVASLIEASARCAQAASDYLATDDGPTLVPFAAGPLLPRDRENHSRLELVLPHRQDRD